MPSAETGARATATAVSGSDVSLRPVEDRDLPALLALRRDQAAQHALLAHPASADMPAVRSWIDRREQDPGGLFRIIDRQGAAVGFVQLSRVHRLDRYGYGGICLAAAARGQGLGRAAMVALLAAARECGLLKMLLEVRSDNAAGLRLYLDLAFRRVGVLRAHYHDGVAWHDVVLLERAL